METRTEVRTIKVQYKCPKCQLGYLEFVGKAWVFYVHRCTNKECLHEEKLSNKEYPFLEYQELTKKQLLSSSRRGYVVTEIEEKKCLLYGYPTGDGEIWECYGYTINISQDQQEKVTIKDIFLVDEVEIKEMPIEGTILTQKVAFIKSLM